MGLKIDFDADLSAVQPRSMARNAAGNARKRVTVTWFAHCLRKQYELNLIQEGFSDVDARQIAHETDIRILPGRCQTHPPEDPRARQCLESADAELSRLYAV